MFGGELKAIAAIPTSTGPKTQAGKSRIAAAQRMRWQLWRFQRSGNSGHELMALAKVLGPAGARSAILTLPQP